MAAATYRATESVIRVNNLQLHRYAGEGRKGWLNNRTRGSNSCVKFMRTVYVALTLTLLGWSLSKKCGGVCVFGSQSCGTFTRISRGRRNIKGRAKLALLRLQEFCLIEISMKSGKFLSTL